MKSKDSVSELTIAEITQRIRALIKTRINSGDFTERSFARIFNISQPHLHNMLKGERRLPPAFLDQVLARFDLTILDLVSAAEIWEHLDKTSPDWLAEAAQRKPPERTRERAAWTGKRFDSGTR